jgi:hypothetical protein
LDARLPARQEIFIFLIFGDALASVTCLPQAGLRKIQISPKETFLILQSFRSGTKYGQLAPRCIMTFI